MSVRHNDGPHKQEHEEPCNDTETMASDAVDRPTHEPQGGNNNSSLNHVKEPNLRVRKFKKRWRLTRQASFIYPALRREHRHIGKRCHSKNGPYKSSSD